MTKIKYIAFSNAVYGNVMQYNKNANWSTVIRRLGVEK
jgi:hypothetical protein